MFRMRFTHLTPILLLSLFLAGCSEENPATSDVGDNQIDPALLAEFSDIYLRAPNLSACDPGEINPSERARALAYVNEIRALHRLPAVTYASQHDEKTEAAAMIIAVNNFLAHNPPSSLPCWSEEGLAGSKGSNLTWSARKDDEHGKIFTTDYLIDTWWKDSAVELVGHRRWMLDPFLREISFGRVDTRGSEEEYAISGAALWVIDDARTPPENIAVDFVAYPFELYPASLFNAGISLSFSAVVDREDYWANQDVDLSEAAITVTGPAGAAVAVSNVRRQDDAFGIPNALLWNADVQPGVRYDVTISGVLYNGSTLGYEYWFETR